jgi:uncharacterized protein
VLITDLAKKHLSAIARNVTILEKWKTLLALPIIAYGAYQGWQWIWGVLFLIWLQPSIKLGEINLVEPVNQEDDKFLFWLIVILWVGSSIYLITFDLLPPLLNLLHRFL